MRYLNSSLADIAYIFDEPSAGLHPRDVHQLNALLRGLRDKGNTVLVVEHDPDVIAIANSIVDMGPATGINGGRVVYQGDYAGLRRSDTPTARALSRPLRLNTQPRKATGQLRLHDVSLHNLHHLNVSFPMVTLTVVTGVAGSEKSTLVNRLLPRYYPHAVLIDQRALGGTRRSTIASYMGIAESVRALFARVSGHSASLFSNNGQGACPECRATLERERFIRA